MFLNLDSRYSLEKRPTIKVKHDNPTALPAGSSLFDAVGYAPLKDYHAVEGAEGFLRRHALKVLHDVVRATSACICICTNPASARHHHQLTPCISRPCRRLDDSCVSCSSCTSCTPQYELKK